MPVLKMLARHRWFVLAILFLVLNTCAVYLHANRQTVPQDVSVKLITPQDGCVASGSKDSLKWRFSTRMVV